MRGSAVPLGPGDTWKTGQRVPYTGYYVDQRGIVTYHTKHATFPPVVSRLQKGECAFRTFLGVTLPSI